MEFSEIITALRIEANLSRKKMAEKLGVTQACIGYWENGKKKPSYDLLRHICIVLDVSADIILGFEDIQGKFYIAVYGSNKMDKIEFKDIIKQLRLEAGLSINALAKEIGVSPTCVCYWENGKRKPDYDQIKQICIVLGVSANVVLGLENY